MYTLVRILASCAPHHAVWAQAWAAQGYHVLFFLFFFFLWGTFVEHPIQRGLKYTKPAHAPSQAAAC